MNEKRPYEKPGIVFENFETGELTGTPELIERIMAKEYTKTAPCPFEDFSCASRCGS